MKQRCAILSCDYFDGGECAGFCLQADTRQPVPPLPIDVAVPDPEPEPDPREEYDDRTETLGMIVALLVVFMALGMALFSYDLARVISLWK